MVKNSNNIDSHAAASRVVLNKPGNKDDKLGFAEIHSPSHSLQLLNKYTRTNLIILVHGFYHEAKAKAPRASPLKLLKESIQLVLTACENNPNMYHKLEPSKLHIHYGFVLQPEEDFKHDVKLLKYHLESHKKTLKQVDRRIIDA